MHIKDAVGSQHISHGDAEILLAHICGKPRTWIFAHENDTLTPEEEHTWSAYRKRREQGEPVAYIIGKKEFFGRSFHVGPSVLIPRPSTEGLVEMVLAMLQKKCVTLSGDEGRHTANCQCDGSSPLTMTHRLDTGIIGMSEIWGQLSDILTIVDVGTGSGCIAITLACELPEINVIATDINTAALHIARTNAKRHGVGERIWFIHGNLLEPILDLKTPFLLIANPPYIPAGEKLPTDVTEYEPIIALRGGPDGLAILQPLLTAARTHPACRGFIVECREDQWTILRGILDVENSQHPGTLQD